jgi:hypothetical protein
MHQQEELKVLVDALKEATVQKEVTVTTVADAVSATTPPPPRLRPRERPTQRVVSKCSSHVV